MAAKPARHCPQGPPMQPPASGRKTAVSPLVRLDPMHCIVLWAQPWIMCNASSSGQPH